MAHLNKQNPIPVSARQYCLERIPVNEIGRIFGALFGTPVWHTLMDRRDKFCRMFTKFRPGTSEANSAYKEIVKIDEKAAGILLTTLVSCYIQLDNINSKRKVTLAEFKSDFVKTPEQEEIYHTFDARLDQANFLVDVVDSLITDAKEQLTKLDPNGMLTEFDSINQVQSILRNYSSIHHSKEHPEFFDCFSKYSDEITDFCYLKSAQFAKEYHEIYNRLSAAGEIKPHTNEKAEHPY